MEDDKFLRSLLNQGAVEEAPSDFSAGVMKNIEALNLQKAVEGGRLKQIYTIVFLAITTVVVALSFFVTPNDWQIDAFVDLSFIQSKYIVTALLLLPSFWVLLLFSNWLEKQRPAFP